MPAAEHLPPDLGPDFDTRWRRASRALRRELIAEIRSIYLMLKEDDMPLLAGAPATRGLVLKHSAPTITTRSAKPEQASLFSAAGKTPAASRNDNPFLPQGVRDRLQHSQPHTQTQTRAPLQELLQKPQTLQPPASHEQVDLERELRLRLGPVIETLIESHLESLKGELRVRLRAEMDRLIAQHLQK